MKFLLCITLLCMLCLDYTVYKNILLPSFVMTASFFLSSVIAVLASDIVVDDIDVNTYFVVISSIIMFMVGEIIVLNKKFGSRALLKNYENSTVNQGEFALSISKKTVYVFAVLIVVVGGIKFYALCSMAGVSASISSFFDAYSRIRFLLIHGESMNISGYIGYLSIVILCFARTCITVFSYNCIHSGFMIKRYAFVVLLFLVSLITTTARTVYLDMLVYILFQWLFLSAHNWRFALNRRNILFLFAIAFSFMILFFFVGNLADKNHSVVLSLFGYSGAAYLGLDQYLASPYYASDVFSLRTLQGILVPLSKFGLEISTIDEFLPHYWFMDNTLTSNEYTSLMEPIYDYGICGMFITRIVLGAIYGTIFLFLTRNSIMMRKPVWITILCPLYYALAISSIDDQFSSYIGLYYAYQIIFTYLIWKYFVKTTCINEENSR